MESDNEATRLYRCDADKRNGTEIETSDDNTRPRKHAHAQPCSYIPSLTLAQAHDYLLEGCTHACIQSEFQTHDHNRDHHYLRPAPSRTKIPPLGSPSQTPRRPVSPSFPVLCTTQRNPPNASAARLTSAHATGGKTDNFPPGRRRQGKRAGCALAFDSTGSQGVAGWGGPHVRVWGAKAGVGRRVAGLEALRCR